MMRQGISQQADIGAADVKTRSGGRRHNHVPLQTAQAITRPVKARQTVAQ